MKLLFHRWRFLAFLLIIALLFAACGINAQNQNRTAQNFTSFRDVPGVTEDEIKAVEALQERYSSFVYAMPASTEAFIDENGEINGFSALVCEWLTEIFGIPFIPTISPFAEVLAGLNTGEIDFTGTMTPTPERLEIYYMTSPIVNTQRCLTIIPKTQHPTPTPYQWY